MLMVNKSGSSFKISAVPSPCKCAELNGCTQVSHLFLNDIKEEICFPSKQYASPKHRLTKKINVLPNSSVQHTNLVHVEVHDEHALHGAFVAQKRGRDRQIVECLSRQEHEDCAAEPSKKKRKRRTTFNIFQRPSFS
jgi:hypothetical protein